MKFQYLGTAAAEGIPALFCDCEICKKSRESGGRALRTRSQAIIDDRLLLDFPADTYSHLLANRLDLTQVSDCLITHRHADHLYARDIRMLEPGFSHVSSEYKLSFYGSDKVGEDIKPILSGRLEKAGLCSFREVKPFESFEAGTYTVTALPAVHDPNAGPLFYIITDGDKTILYAHDTHFFRDDVWAFFAEKKPEFDFVSLDCTNVCTPLTYVGHMSFTENIQVRDRMRREGYADEKTLFVCNHFSHNGAMAFYDDFVPIAAREGFLVSYDGMVVNI